MKSSAGKIALAGLNDLFQTGGETVQEVPLSELFPFKNHPFQVRDDEAMRKTVESIVRSGVLSPGIVRPRPEGGYEIIAGHRRKRGSELAGRETMPVLIRMLDDDEATIIMVDSNLQREKILPSEKAFAYKMKLEALKHQGQRTDLTSDHGGQKLTARERVAQDAGETSGTAVARYISLTKLLPPRLALVPLLTIFPACRKMNRRWSMTLPRLSAAMSAQSWTTMFPSPLPAPTALSSPWTAPFTTMWS